jgi:3-hydroxymyristoyl/3-hydroxydecanoyl-(acyl carrier protein) dehydratase
MTPTFNWQHQVPSDHACFPHHFAGDALVPGALLLHWINTHLAEHFKMRISAIKQIKFLHPVRPAEIIEVAFYSLEKKHQFRLEVIFAQTQTDILKGQVQLSSIDIEVDLP